MARINEKRLRRADADMGDRVVPRDPLRQDRWELDCHFHGAREVFKPLST